jgi:hypothetical protein
MEVLSVSKQSRDIDVISSAISLYALHQKIASSLNIFPDSLQAQYRFSTDPKGTLPCDLVTHAHFSTLLKLLRERSVPAKLRSGLPSAKRMKAFTLQVFNKGDSPYSAENKVSKIAQCASAQQSITFFQTTKSKSNTVTKEQVKTQAETMHEQRIVARQAIAEHFTCEMHSLPNKPVLCFKNPTTGLCHPITENNLSLWAALHVRTHSLYILFSY